MEAKYQKEWDIHNALTLHDGYMECEKKPDSKSSNNIVRAEFLISLLRDIQHNKYPNKHTLIVAGAWVDDNLNLMNSDIKISLMFEKSVFEKPINIRDARFESNFLISNSTAPGIDADRVKIRGQFRSVGNHLSGNLRFTSARLDGAFGFEDSSLEGNLDLSMSKVHGSVVITRSHINGQLKLERACIKNGLSIGESKLCTTSNKPAIFGVYSRIMNGLFIGANTEIIGQVRFTSGNFQRVILKNLHINTGLIQSSFSIDGADVDELVFENVTSTNEINLLSLKIGRDLNLSGLKIKNNLNGRSLSADGLTVGGMVRITDAYEGNGKSSFVGMNCTMLILAKLKEPLNEIDLSNAQIKFLQDSIDSWGDDISLDGLNYTAFMMAPKDAESRSKWLLKQKKDDLKDDGFCHQPWQQAIGALGNNGHHEEAIKLSIKYEDIKIKNIKVSRFKRLFSYISKYFINYGYHPHRLLFWSFGSWLLCGCIYYYSALYGLMAPTNPLIFQSSDYIAGCRSYDDSGKKLKIVNEDKSGITHNWYTCGSLRGEYTTFSPFAYSLDVALPLIDLGQSKDWGVYVETPQSTIIDELSTFSGNKLVRLCVWVQTLVGWIISLVAVAWVSGYYRKGAHN